MPLTDADLKSLFSEQTKYRVFRQVLSKPVTAAAVEDFAKGFGDLSLRDGGTGSWPVQPRKSTGTYSEIAGPAGFHTDSQYHQYPEPLFILACNTPAADGGDNLLISMKDAYQVALEALGSQAVERMKQSVWSWAVPAVFRSKSTPAFSPPSPIFLKDGTIRWRSDNIVCKNDSDLSLAQAFEKAIQESSFVEHVRLESGDVLLCDNWHALHARTDFSDMSRLMYRARCL
ncbi:TauD/TfdA family dioxygenase [Synechococcus sp. UW140]|uniref:TauD/TfdA family dioxygenase n=1 Tax=Synechococcus sp. UW140 TaxID=368503 RepID=UPI000E0EC4DD|nr:TauD/TfdA family dioxygenase [Synechococcus sp. UW140]